MISAIYDLAHAAGANRVVKGVRIEHVVGDPGQGPENEYARGMRIVRAALNATATPITLPTIFDPEEGRS